MVGFWAGGGDVEVEVGDGVGWTVDVTVLVGVGVVDDVVLGDTDGEALADGLGEELSQIPGNGIGSGHEDDDDGLVVAVALALGEAEAASHTPGIEIGNGQVAAGTADGRAVWLAAGAAWAATMPRPASPVAINPTASAATRPRNREVEAGSGMSTVTYFNGARDYLACYGQVSTHSG